MWILYRIKEDHTKKSKQLKELKKKMHNRIPVAKLKDILSYERSYNIDWRDYDGVDEEAYSIDVAKKEARIELLEELIREYE